MRRGVVERALALVGRKPAVDLSAVEEGLERAAAALGLPVEDAVTQAAAGDPSVYGVVVSSLTVGETYFFRHPEHFEYLVEFARTRAEGGRPLQSAWSVGCSTGEEPYSLALALQAHAPALEVLGSDASPRSLAHARRGLYGLSAFRGKTDPSVQPGLRSVRGQWTVEPSVRRRVHFQELNLASENVAPPEDFPVPVDLIVCRNVLIYFTPQLALDVVTRLGSFLADDGLLLLGALEGPWDAPPGLERVDERHGACIFQKERRRHAAPERALAAALPPPPAALSAPKAAIPGPGPGALSVSALKLPARDRERIQALFAEEDLAGAIKELARFPQDPEALALTAQLHEELGNFRQAELSWRRLLLVEPGFLEAHLRLALSAARMRDTGEVARRTRSLQDLLGTMSDDEEVRGLKAGYVRTVLAALALPRPNA